MMGTLLISLLDVQMYSYYPIIILAEIFEVIEMQFWWNTVELLSWLIVEWELFEIGY